MELKGIWMCISFWPQKQKNFLSVRQYFVIVEGFLDSQILVIRLRFTFGVQLPQ